MNDKERSSKYYVVGGPVQPDRDCYITRDADAAMYARLHEAEYCHVLAPRQTGKTSLAARTAQRLRQDGMLVALVDLSQTGGGDHGEEAGRWYYSIAYRIVRDLRIRSDMQAWWKDHSGLTNLQRLREFFLEIVLTETEQPVVVVFDRLESTLRQPLAQDLFGAIRSCYDARATEPEYERLTFALLGSVAPSELIRGVHDSPFEISASIPLRDFRKDEMRQLVAGLGDLGGGADSLVDRVWTWTHGHPYLSQKIFRGLARKVDETLTARTVDDLVEGAFLNPNATTEEPHLSLISERLLADSPRKIARLNLYGRVRKGADIPGDPSVAIQRDLLMSGIVVEDNAGNLVVRNTIYAEAFGTKWVNQNLPFGWRGFGMAAVLLALILAVPVWYSEYLPRPYMRTLSAATEDYQVALDAYESLHRLPGFGRTADQLFTDFLTRQSRRSTTLDGAMRAHGRLMQIPMGSDRAEGLLAEFWDRRAALFMHDGNRDGALISALRAMQEPNDRRRQLAAELIGDDYQRLSGTIRSAGAIRFIETDAAAGLLSVMDDGNTVQVWELAGAAPRHVKTVELVAEQRVQLQRRLMVSSTENARRLSLSISTDHPRPGQVEVQLRAPSGREVNLRLDSGSNSGEFRFDSRDRDDLRALLADDVTGTWTASFTDTEQGVRGQLLNWDLQINGRTADRPADSVVDAELIPEPQASARLASILGPSGNLALVWPEDREVRGEVLVWDLAAESVLTRIPRGDDFISAYFVLGGAAVVTIDSRQLVVWEAASGSRLGEITVSVEQSSRPVLSRDGRYLVVDELRAESGNALVVWDLQQLSAIGELVIGGRSGPVAVDPSGQYLAIGDDDRLVRIWALNDLSLVRELEHGAAPRTLVFGPSGQWLATGDVANTFRLWNLETGTEPLIERVGNAPWRVAFSNDADELLVGSDSRPYTAVTLPQGTSLGVTLRHPGPATERLDGVDPLPPLLLTEQNLAVTHDGDRGLKVWRLPPMASSQSAEIVAAVPGTRATVSPTGDRIAIGTAEGDVRILSVSDGAGLSISAGDGPRFIGHTSEVSSLSFLDDGTLVASGSIGGSVRVWEVGSGAPRDFIAIHPDGAVLDLLFVDSGNFLASASRNRVILTDARSGQQVAELRVQGTRPQLSLAAELGLILIAGDQDGLTLWDWRKNSSERVIDAAGEIRNAAATSDGELVVTLNPDGVLTLWNLSAREPLVRTVRSAGNVDDLWIPVGSEKLIVHSGHWMQSMFMYPVGLASASTRLLSGSPEAVQPSTSGRSIFVLLQPFSARPLVTEIDFDSLPAGQLEGSPDELEKEWHERLALTFDAAGELESL